MFSFKKIKLKLISLFFVALGSVMFSFTNLNQTVNSNNVIDNKQLNENFKQNFGKFELLTKLLYEYENLNSEITNNAEKATEENKKKLEQLIHSLKTTYCDINFSNTAEEFEEHLKTVTLSEVSTYVNKNIEIVKKYAKYFRADLFDKDDFISIVMQQPLLQNDMIFLILQYPDVNNSITPNDKINIEIAETGTNNIVINRDSEVILKTTNSSKKYMLTNCWSAKDGFKENGKYNIKLIKNDEEIYSKEFIVNFKNVDADFLNKINMKTFNIEENKQ